MIRTWKWIWNHPLTRRRRFAAMMRWFRWQVGSRIVGHPVVVPFVGESCLVVERSMTGATGNIYCGLHEFSDMAFVLHFLRRTDVFVDVGANIGSYTVLASGVVGCRTVSLEPVPGTFCKLERNVRINGIEERVQLHHCAAGAREGEVWFRTDHDTMNSVVREGDPVEKIRVVVRGLDTILGGGAGELWKVDVEGYEWEVLQGASGSLSDFRLRAVMLEGNDERIAALMRGAGFESMVYDPWERRLESIPVGVGGKATGNHLWVRDRNWVEERCRGASKVELNGERF
jgi:FkbM family methyltransferase